MINVLLHSIGSRKLQEIEARLNGFAITMLSQREKLDRSPDVSKKTKNNNFIFLFIYLMSIKLGKCMFAQRDISFSKIVLEKKLQNPSFENTTLNVIVSNVILNFKLN